MANTTRGIPYPDDYTTAADVPAALEALALSADDAIDTVDTKATSAASVAVSAASSAATANTAVASHNHSGTGSANIAISAITGLNTTLSAKADASHDHNLLYAALGHEHTAQEIGAHTHPDYAASTHTHTQVQSHTTPDTDSSPGALHHTLGTGANQAAAGNHSHSAYAATAHTHTEYSPSAHTHTGYSVEGHTHSYAATDHSHSAYSPTSHTHSAYASTSHDHNYAATNHSHTSFSGNLRVTGFYTADGMKKDTSTNAPNVRVNSNGEIQSTSYSVSAQRYKVDITPIDGSDLSATVQPQRLGTPNAANTIDPYDVLSLVPIAYRWESSPELVHTGFLAEDVEQKFPSAVVYDEDEVLEGVDTRGIISSLIYIVRQQQERLADLEQRLA